MIDIQFERINHVHICIPKGTEAEARAFYCDLLGLEELEQPSFLTERGGLWLRMADIELHIGVEDLENKSSRHPAFEITNLDEVKAAFISQGIRIRESQPLPNYKRFSFYDPFNNRIELMERI